MKNIIIISDPGDEVEHITRHNTFIVIYEEAGEISKEAIEKLNKHE